MKDLAISFFIAIKLAIVLLLVVGVLLGVGTVVVYGLQTLTGSTEISAFILIGMVLFGLLWGLVHDVRRNSNR